MIRYLVIFVVLYFAATSVYRLMQPAPTVSNVSPEEQFRNIEASGTVTADQFCFLCDSYPQLAAKYLRTGMPLRLTGNVHDFRVTGLDGRHVNVMLSQSRQRPLIAVYDLDHYGVLGLEPIWDHRVHYLVVGNELLKVTPAGIYHRGLERIEISEEQRATVFTRATPYEDTVTLTAINPSGILVAAAAK